MGHERLGALPRSKSWQRIVAEISEFSSESKYVKHLANATLKNVRTRFARASQDKGVKAAFQFLVALSVAASPDEAVASTSCPQIDLRRGSSPLKLASSLRDWVNQHRQSSEHAELAQRAGTDAIALWVKLHDQPTMFPGHDPVPDLWRKTATGSGFCEISRLFFARFTERYLKYFLDREASAALSSIQQREDFAYCITQHIDEISGHAFETARIAQSFAAGWFNKHARSGMPSGEVLEHFLSYAFGKIREELLREEV